MPLQKDDAIGGFFQTVRCKPGKFAGLLKGKNHPLSRPNFFPRLEHLIEMGVKISFKIDVFFPSDHTNVSNLSICILSLMNAFTYIIYINRLV